jgi:hypothetical protein
MVAIIDVELDDVAGEHDDLAARPAADLKHAIDDFPT